MQLPPAAGSEMHREQSVRTKSDRGNAFATIKTISRCSDLRDVHSSGDRCP